MNLAKRDRGWRVGLSKATKGNRDESFTIILSCEKESNCNASCAHRGADRCCCYYYCWCWCSYEAGVACDRSWPRIGQSGQRLGMHEQAISVCGIFLVSGIKQRATSHSSSSTPPPPSTTLDRPQGRFARLTFYWSSPYRRLRWSLEVNCP